ncbi:MAG: cryptochrome/photolyase family protein [Opitutales bacterium]|jgi:deoxyribodipyrimidine photo-lyase
MHSVIVWFRKDLRLEDNPAWGRAVATGQPVVPVYIHSIGEASGWEPGAASRWWLHHALKDLAAQLEKTGSRLILRSGIPAQVLEELVQESGSTGVYWNRCYEPWRVREDGRLKTALSKRGLDVWSGNGSLLREPWEVATAQGGAYKVYTPFARALTRMPIQGPLGTLGPPAVPDRWPNGDALDSLSLLPAVPWDAGLAKAWIPSRKVGLECLGNFIETALGPYDRDRDYPGIDGTSRLSPYLQWGQIGPREVVARVSHCPDSSGKATFLKELYWREFANHVLYHFPDTTERPLQPAFGQFPWRHESAELKLWHEGKTGYPIVDAGMRQLWQTGWMHNRVRMIVASFLVKHLLHSWKAGARWFWDTLVDADLANNTLGWQWAGGCGADAAPYFRVFNPIIQGRKFDPEGRYIRRYVSELESVPVRHIHAPWGMTQTEQEQSHCRIGRDYPQPVIEHTEGRARALAAWKEFRK